MIKKVRFRASRWCFHITRVNIFFNVIVIFVIFSRFCHCCLVTKTIITVGRIHIINPFHFSLIKQVVIEIGLNGEVLTLRFDLIEGWWKIMTWSFSYHFFHFGDLFQFRRSKMASEKKAILACFFGDSKFLKHLRNENSFRSPGPVFLSQPKKSEN